MLPPTHFFGFLIIFTVFTAGFSASVPEEFKDNERRSCFNQSDLIESENGDLQTRNRRSTEFKRTLEGKMYSDDCALIGTVGVGETYKLDVRNSKADDNVPIPLLPIFSGPSDKTYLLSIMCPENARVEVEHLFKDRRFETDTFVFDCVSSLSRIYDGPSLTRHIFNIKNVGGFQNNKKIMFKIEQIRTRKCNEIDNWKKQQNKRQRDPFTEKINKYLEGVELYDALSKMTTSLANLAPIPGLGSAVDFLWKYIKTPEWDKKLKEVLVHINNATVAQNLILCRQRLEGIQISIENLKAMRQRNISESDYYTHFAQVSEKLITTHVHYQFNDLETNLAVLPLLTLTISFIVEFFSVILYDPAYKMNDERMTTVRETRATLLRNVNDHILRMYEDEMTNAFNYCDETNMFKRTEMYIYDCVADAHNMMAVKGLKFLSVWNKLAHFESHDPRTIHVPMYSHYFGRPTNDLIRDLYLSNMISLLTPPVYDLTGCYGNSPNPNCFLRKKVTAVNVIYADESDPKQISMVLFSHDGEPEFDKRLGVRRYYEKSYYQTFEVPERFDIVKIKAGVDDKLRYLEFYLSDDSMPRFYGRGFNDKSIPQTTFELADHYIADILVKSDGEKYFRYGPVAYGISVSYLPNPRLYY